MNYCVITTINHPTKAVEELYKRFGNNLIVIGDKKTPDNWKYKDARFVTDFHSLLYAPDNHYARKNVGYLTAIANEASLIYDTDDDNIPYEEWKVRNVNVNALKYLGEGWFNAYSEFTQDFIWPRGFPLKNIRSRASIIGFTKNAASSIQQGLADKEPDVDAIWRLVFKKEHYFKAKKSIYLQPYAWCPFNSQSTWWFPKAYPLMYLPIYASFRMTDIWRSFVAQRCLWELGEGVTFHSPSEVFQDRNEHDLMSDFADEIDGYLNNDRIVSILGTLPLKKGDENVCGNLLTCYEALVREDILVRMELDSVKSWIKDYEAVRANI